MRPPRKVDFLALGFALTFLMSALPLRAQSPSPSPAETSTVTKTITLAEYRAELAAAIATLEAVPDEEGDTTVESLSEQFATITSVQFPSGDIVDVSASPILDNLEYSDEQYWDEETEFLTQKNFALIRLHGAIAQIDASASDNTAARLAILAQVLARPEFNSPMSLWDRFWQWLRNLIANLLPESSPGGDAGWLAFLLNALPWIISILIVAAIIWLLSYWLQRLLRSFVTDERVHELAGDDDLPRSAAEARQQARAAAQSGLYRDAVRRLYLAALLQLAEHDLITYERSLTNREVLVRVPKDSPIRAYLEPVVATFDQVWYGVREPDQTTFTQYEQEIDALAAIATQTSATAKTPSVRGAS